MCAIRSVVLVAMLVAACSPDPDTEATSGRTDAPPAAAAESDTGAVHRVIAAAQARAAEAVKRGDTVAALANYADDAVIMWPGYRTLRGREELRRAIPEMFPGVSITEATGKSDEVILGGDLAVETGTYENTLQPRGGQAFTDRGRYLDVWRRQPDGSWRIVREINFSDSPPAGSAAAAAPQNP